jgi:hypothetical protein
MGSTVTRSGLLLASILLPYLFACSSMEIQTAVAPQAHLSQYKTYAWAPRPASIPAKPQHAAILEETVQSAIEEDVAQKGLVPAQDAPPDLLIGYYGTSRDSVSFGIAPSYGYGYGGGYYSGGYYKQPYVTREGSLTLQFIDAKTNKVVWQGTASDSISEAGASQEQVKKAVNDLIEKYPVA